MEGERGSGDAGRPAGYLGVDDNTLKVWDLATGALERTLTGIMIG